MDARKATTTIAVTLLCVLVFAPALAAGKGDKQDLREAIEALKEGQRAIQGQIGLREEIEALKQGQAEIRKQLEEIKKLVEARPAAAQRPAAPSVADVVFDLGENPVVGESDAKLTLVEFTDYQCPFCSRHLNNTHRQIEETYVETGKLRFATLDLPLESIHKLAFKAAQAAHCAGDQGKFWEMRERLFKNQRALEPWSGHAEALGLDVAMFDDCLNSEKYADAVRKDMAQARKAGATGTPSFVLAKTDPNDPAKVTGISFIRGAKSFNDFKAEIDKALGN